MKVSDQIGIPALLEQTAEECMELAHACLKLARILRKENPTPCYGMDVVKNVNEEAADILVCLDALYEASIISDDAVEDIKNIKKERWKSRIAENIKERMM